MPSFYGHDLEGKFHGVARGIRFCHILEMGPSGAAGWGFVEFLCRMLVAFVFAMGVLK